MSTFGLLAAVLVELFTSEGCSSCPPADRLLAALEAQGDAAASVEIVPLSFHVDYWNYLGWRDPFSSREFTARQMRYGAGVYTPQMIVDGADAFVGSDRRAAEDAIAAAARRPRLKLEVRPAKVGKELVAVDIRIDAEGVELDDTGSEVFLAVTEGGLASNVTRGENSGRKLSHAAVVRKLVSLGDVSFDGEGNVERSHTVRLERDWNPERLHIAVWVQGPERVLGAARAPIASGHE